MLSCTSVYVLICVWLQRLKYKVYVVANAIVIYAVNSVICMANETNVTRVFSKKCAYLLCISLIIAATITCYQSYVVQLSFVPTVGQQHCNWMKAKREKLQRNTPPPWFSLQANYGNTIRSGKNLYVWSAYAHNMRLGNKLFNYAATFGIAWRNRRIPSWPQNRRSGHDITKFFNLRIRSPDRRNNFLHVSFISY